MFKRIQQWIYALRVCKKYNLKWDMCVSLNTGQYVWDLKRNMHTIRVNPFVPCFKSIFMHEVGHFIHNKKVNYDVFFLEHSGVTDKGVCIFKILEAEIQATKFAVRCGSNKQRLRTALNTYTSHIFKSRSLFYENNVEHIFEQYVDVLGSKTKFLYAGM